MQVEDIREIRRLWQLGVSVKTIRGIFSVSHRELVEIIKLPKDWEAKAA